MSDQSIRDHIARMNQLRRMFAEFWAKHCDKELRGKSALHRSEVMVKEWNAFRTAMNHKLDTKTPCQ
jgi:uncharacterized protein Usg